MKKTALILALIILVMSFTSCSKGSTNYIEVETQPNIQVVQ